MQTEEREEITIGEEYDRVYMGENTFDCMPLYRPNETFSNILGTRRGK